MGNHYHKAIWLERACKAIIGEIRRAKIKGYVITPIGDFEPYIANYLAKTGVLTDYGVQGYMTWKYLSAWRDMVNDARRYVDTANQSKRIETNIEIIMYSMSGQFSDGLMERKSLPQWNAIYDAIVIEEQDKQDLAIYMKWVQDTYKILYPDAKPSQSLIDTLTKLVKIEPTIPTNFSTKTKEKSKKLKSL